jgi:hypothetical protein
MLPVWSFYLGTELHVSHPPELPTSGGPTSRPGILPANLDDPRFSEGAETGRRGHAEWTAGSAMGESLTEPLDEAVDLVRPNSPFFPMFILDFITEASSTLLGALGQVLLRH